LRAGKLAINPNSAAVTDHELSEIRALLERRSGILFEGARERSFATRVRAHVAEHGWPNGARLLRAIRSSNVEFERLLERLLTQETSFFRYPDVFDALQKHMLPELQKNKAGQGSHSLRLWSAGCASGEEPYSIAIAVTSSSAYAEAWDITILATDISRAALQQAERGAYSRRRLHGLPAPQVEACFSREDGDYVVKPHIRSLVSFALFNLAEPVYLGRFDCIFCMNVLIYFSAERRADLIRQFYEYLEPGGFLILGHAETVNGAAVEFRTIVHGEARVFQKAGLPAALESGTETGRSVS
jgi:chemotaxis protein methyltransferase CheR